MAREARVSARLPAATKFCVEKALDTKNGGHHQMAWRGATWVGEGRGRPTSHIKKVPQEGHETSWHEVVMTL